MSSFPQHKDNLKDLKSLGFDVSEFDTDPFESWNYDDLVYLVAEIVIQLKAKGDNQ